MTLFNRRDLLRIGCGVALSPLATAVPVLAGNRLAASQFSSGGMRGFVIGRVEHKDPAYFASLAGTGAKVGRIFFSFSKCRDCDRYGLAFEVREQVRNVLELARARGLHLVMVGEFPGTGQPGFWSNSSLRGSFVENWRLFAKWFGSDPVIIGLDLLNEPNPPWPSGRLVDAHALWKPLAERAVMAIREVAPSVPIIYEGVAGGASLGLRDLVPLQDGNVVYSIHHYSPHDITHQHVSDAWSRSIPYPAGKEWGLGKWDAEFGVGAWDRQRMEVDLRDTIAFQRRFKVPVYVGEFSCVRWAPGKSRERYLSDSLAIFRKYGWSWTYHEFRGWPGWDAEIASAERERTERSADSSAMKMLMNELRGKSQ